VAKSKPVSKRRGKAAMAATADLPSSEEEALFLALKGLRKRLADSRKVPAYVIFSDATLLALAAARPRTRAEFLAVPAWAPRNWPATATSFSPPWRPPEAGG